MCQVKKYKEILESIFKIDISFNDYSIENNCIGALSHKDEYDIFTNNFTSRLERLNSHFISNPDILKEIIKTAKIIGQTKGYKWSGAYSELVALDYWIQFTNLKNLKFPHRGNVATFADSIAKVVGHEEIDLDISFDITSTKIHTDVKSLIPTHTELTDTIISNLKPLTGNNDYLINVDNIYDVDYIRTKKDLTFELQHRGLIDNLAACINKKQCSYSHKLESGDKINFRIAHKKANKMTILTTIREMHPHKLALDYKYKILDYYNKLLIDKPSLITFVVNPWFNQELNTDKKFLEVFFRALTRRIFMELTKEDTEMENLYPQLKGYNLKISDIASKITGVIFIVDNSILNNTKDIYDTYIYLNPNATNTVLTESDLGILSWMPKTNHPFIDDFRYDNY